MIRMKLYMCQISADSVSKWHTVLFCQLLATSWALRWSFNYRIGAYVGIIPKNNQIVFHNLFKIYVNCTNIYLTNLSHHSQNCSLPEKCLSSGTDSIGRKYTKSGFIFSLIVTKWHIIFKWKNVKLYFYLIFT